ncbi:hypothetical protein MMC31_005467 [Peltigera leucophlebia]|nr:hypothetical protein [Peltigera leucophlebia]
MAPSNNGSKSVKFAVYASKWVEIKAKSEHREDVAFSKAVGGPKIGKDGDVVLKKPDYSTKTKKLEVEDQCQDFEQRQAEPYTN